MTELPISLFLALGLLFCLLLLAFAKRDRPWAIPFGTVAATVGAWYLLEPFYFPDEFATFEAIHVSAAYNSVCIFFLTFLLLGPWLSNVTQPATYGTARGLAHVSIDKVVAFVALFWLALLAIGTMFLGGDLVGALFPMGSRTGPLLWSRAAADGAGSTGFLLSIASYLYILCIAAFGVLLFFTKSGRVRAILIVLILISWPYAVLQGSRNILLATAGPGALAFLIYGKVSAPKKIAIAAAGLLVLDYIMRAIIVFRTTGFENFDALSVENAAHFGLSMGSELVHITRFLDEGVLSINYGTRYLAELANVVPRAIWPSKPLLGIDYALARGFGSTTQDIGVLATISTGLIGQGVVNFGSIAGPIAAAALMSFWVALLARFKLQGTPLRAALYLLGLGLTFNLGRDLTLLVLWPFVFGYFGVRIIEGLQNRRRIYSHSARSTRPTHRAPFTSRRSVGP